MPSLGLRGPAAYGDPAFHESAMPSDQSIGECMARRKAHLHEGRPSRILIGPRQFNTRKAASLWHAALLLDFLRGRNLTRCKNKRRLHLVIGRQSAEFADISAIPSRENANAKKRDSCLSASTIAKYSLLYMYIRADHTITII